MYLIDIPIFLLFGFVFPQGWLYRLEQEGSSQAKLLLDRFVARAAELKIPVRTKIELIFISDFTLSCTFVGVLTAAL